MRGQAFDADWIPAKIRLKQVEPNITPATCSAASGPLLHLQSAATRPCPRFSFQAAGINRQEGEQ
jgi:hypothetical protein